MSSSLNIYPFQDFETTIRFVVQVSLFLIGLFITNRLIIKPALRLYEERKKRTTGNQKVALSKQKQAEELERAYQDRLNTAMDSIRAAQADQIKSVKSTASTMLLAAQEKSAQHVEDIKTTLQKEKQDAQSEIHLHINSLVSEIYSKLGVTI